MKGKSIVLSAYPRGVHMEAIAGEAGIKPGHLLRIKPATALDGSGRYTVELWEGNATGERSIVVVADIGFEGQTYDDAYTNGDRVRVYFPLPGEELNVRVKASESIAVGDALIMETTSGLLIETTGTVESEPFRALEALTADGSPVHVIATGV